MQKAQQVIKTTCQVLKPTRSFFYSTQKIVNRELFAKQKFAQKIQKNFYSQANFKSLNSKIVYKFSFPEHTKLAMPALSPSMEKGSIQKWNFKEGDRLEAGDVLCEVETDKSTVGYEMQEEIYLAKILVPEGQEINVGAVVAIAVDDEADVKAFADYKLEQSDESAAEEPEKPPQKPAPIVKEEPVSTPPPAPKQQQQPPQQQQQFQQPPPQQFQQAGGDRIFASPLAKKIANEQGISLQGVQGTGFGGRIIRQDLDNIQYQPQQFQQQAVPQQTQQAQAPASAPAPAQQAQQKFQFASAPGQNPFYDQPNNNTRKTIASRLVQAKQTVPHFYLSVDVSVDKLIETRKQLNSNPDTKISVNDFVIKAVALALRDYPEANCIWQDNAIRYFKNADISVAVSTDGGLITPIVFEANNKGLKEISANVKELAGKARSNKLQPQEYIGGTFTISNLGMFGIDSFSAIINPPQACILAVSQSNKKLVYDPSKEDTEQPYSVQSIMNVTLSCDHRAVDGAVGAQFLQKFKFYIENPTNMLL